MKCPKCQFDNSEGIKFCVECGNKLEIICPKCGYGNLPSHKFCGECGHDFIKPSEAPPKDLTFEEKLTKIQRYLPKGLADKILSQRDGLEGERKQVTVMFCDMEGFTMLSEKIDPEDVYALMDQVYEILIHKVHDYEGTVNEMTGDGIIALFGAPIAIEDAPQRAIRSALAIHREMVRFNDKMKEERPGLPTLKMRIGIHTGPVVVGTLGNDLRVEFKAVGDTVNLASRMEGLAEPETTYVSGETFQLTEGLFRFEGLGEKTVKGKEEPVPVYRVIAPSTRRTRFDVSAERGLTPFAGRERELELLLEAFERAKEGRGQAVSIVADAGVGKSRLLYEFRKAVANEDVTFLEGKCLSYSRGVAYHPVVDILKGNFDIRGGDGDEAIRDKMRQGLKVLQSDDPATVPYLLELLSVKDSGLDQIPLSGEAKRDRTIQALNRIVLQGAGIRPLIMAVEDLHWIDKSSEALFKGLLEQIAGVRVLLLFTYRPEYVHAWGGRSYHAQVNLNRVSNRETLAMVKHMLATDEISEDLDNLILQKTEGVPFFIEEFVRSLRDLKIIARQKHAYVVTKDPQDISIPSTIQDVIMARVDALSEGDKDVLQIGSVIEREFSHELIQKLTGLPEGELLSHLSRLKDAELLYERGVYPHAIYIFKHALTREVLYDSILQMRKKVLHEKVATVMEDIYEGNIYEHYETLCEHFLAGENFEKGANYSRFASKKALKTGSYTDAISYLNKDIFCLENLPGSIGINKRLVEARTTLGTYYIQLNLHIKAKEAVDPIIDFATRNNQRSYLPKIYNALGSYYYFIEENFRLAFDVLEKAIDISDEENDSVSTAQSNYWLGLALAFDCQFDRALCHLEKMLNISTKTKHIWAIAGTKGVIAYWIHCSQGEINLASQVSNEAIRAAEESGDAWSKGIAYSSYGISCYYKGHLEEAKKYLLQGVDCCEKSELLSWVLITRNMLGEVFYELREYDKSTSEYYTGFDWLGNIAFNLSFVSVMRTGLAKALTAEQEAYGNVEQLFELHASNRVKRWDGPTARNIGGVQLNLGERYLSDAGDWIRKAIEADRRNGMMWHLGRDYVLYSKFYKRKGDLSNAKDRLSKAIEIFQECGADGWVEKYEKDLATL